LVRTNWEPNSERSQTLSGPTDEVAARLRDLESEGEILAIDRIAVTTLENEEAQIHLGQSVPIPRGRSFRGPSGPVQTSYEYQSIGTVVTVTARGDGDAVVLKLSCEKSQLAQRDHESDVDEGTVPPGTETLTSQLAVRIESGKTVLASAFDSRTNSESSNVFLLASARILEGSAGKAEAAAAEGLQRSQIKVFTLQYAVAQDAAAIIEQLADGDAGRTRISVDSRTNSVVVSSDNSDQLDVIEAILLRLDEGKPWLGAEPPTEEKKPDATSEVTKYDEMDKQELRDELRRLQAELLDAGRAAIQASERTGEASGAYSSASDDDKADALLRMLDAQAALRTPMARYRQAELALEAAKEAYMRRALAEDR
jgi:hypothetical protein